MDEDAADEILKEEEKLELDFSDDPDELYNNLKAHLKERRKKGIRKTFTLHVKDSRKS